MSIEVCIVDIGCGFCRVLKTAFDSRALDVAMYGGFIMGGIVAKPGRALCLCPHCAERWQLFSPAIEAAFQKWDAEDAARAVAPSGSASETDRG